MLRFSIYRLSKKQRKSNILTKNPLLEENNEAGKSFDQKREKKLGPASSTVENGLKGSKGGKIYYQSKVRRDLLSNLSLEVGLRFFFEHWRDVFTKKRERVACVYRLQHGNFSWFSHPRSQKRIPWLEFFFDPTENQLCSKSGILSVKLVYLLIILGQDENLYKPNDSKIVLIDR